MQVTAAEPRYADTWLGEVDPKSLMNRNCTFGNNKKYHELFSQNDLDHIAQIIDCLLVNKDVDYLQGCLEPPAVKSQTSKAA